MDYIKEMFTRMDLGQIRGFLLRGTDVYDEEAQQPYKDRLENESDPICARLKRIYSDNEDELDNAFSDLYQAMNAYEGVYMEVGMKSGAKLVYQLLLTDEPPCS